LYFHSFSGHPSPLFLWCFSFFHLVVSLVCTKRNKSSLSWKDMKKAIDVKMLALKMKTFVTYIANLSQIISTWASQKERILHLKLNPFLLSSHVHKLNALHSPMLERLSSSICKKIKKNLRVACLK
jgi:hypothetical protein